MKKILATLGLLLLASCSTLQVDSVDNPAPTYNPTPPEPIDFKGIHWKVINNVDLQTLAKSNNTDLVIFALNPDDFKNLMLSLQDTDRFIEEDNSLVLFYRGTPPAAGKTDSE